MKSSKLPCEVCDTPTAIRSTIKTGENKGKKACAGCKHKADGSQISKSSTRLKRITPRRRAARAKERKGLPEFFGAAIVELQKNPYCQNCGEEIKSLWLPHHNIAHILPKSKYKSVSRHPENRLFLCASKDDMNGCHERFDSGFSNMIKMEVFPLAVEKFQKFKGQVTERGKLFHILDQYKPTKQ